MNSPICLVASALFLSISAQGSARAAEKWVPIHSFAPIPAGTPAKLTFDAAASHAGESRLLPFGHPAHLHPTVGEVLDRQINSGSDPHFMKRLLQQDRQGFRPTLGGQVNPGVPPHV